MNYEKRTLRHFKTAIYIFFVLLFLGSSQAYAQEKTVSLEIMHSTDRYVKGETYPVLFSIKIKSGWFIHGFTHEEDYLIPTVLSVDDSLDIAVKITNIPEPLKEKFEYNDQPVEVHKGTLRIKGSITVSPDAPEGPGVIKGELSYQSCSSNMCLPPENIPFSLNLTIVPPGSDTRSINAELFQSVETRKADNTFKKKIDSGIVLALLWILLQGLALNLTPCIYPLIPITVSYFGGRKDRTRGDTILSGIIYISGLAVTNSIMGVTAALSGGMLGAALQYPAVLIGIAIVMTSLGFSFFGFWEFTLPSGLTKLASKNYKGYFGTFFMGLTLGIVAAPCIGPFVLGLLIYVGQTGDPFLGFLYFFVLSIGIGLPLCILAIFSGSINRLPMSGDWMLWVRKIMGWVLIAMGYYFVRNIIPRGLIDSGIILILAVIAGIHLGWIDKTGKGLRLYNYFKKGLSCAVILLGILNFYRGIDLSEGVKWEPYDEIIMQNAVTGSSPVIMDVYADWCIPCRQMDKKVFTDPDIIKLSEKFIMVRLDITRKSESQDEIRKKYSIEGAPTIIFFNRDGKELQELRIESKIDKDDFREQMEKALGN